MNKLIIKYCPKCGWLMRSAWMAQELMHTFASELHAVELAKGPSGHFSIHLNQQEIWNRESNGGFPEITQLKQRVRDIIAPGRHLGHTDKK
ncbi:MAG: SelT/SelW/SelH family protein [Bacteroidales bacterium]|nr:SelT/SelW/SelH family protein [Bacteroidales bacterium]